MQTEHAVRDGTSGGPQRMELVAARAEIEALRAALADAHRAAAQANTELQDAARHRDAHIAALDARLAERANAAAGLQQELEHRDELVAESEARMAESASALTALKADEDRLRAELGVKASAHERQAADLHQALDLASHAESRGQGLGQSARALSADLQVLSTRFAEERDRFEHALQQKSGRIALIERRLTEEREAGHRLRQQFESALIDCSQRVAELQAIVQVRDLRIAMLQGELDVFTRDSVPAPETPLLIAPLVRADAAAGDAVVADALVDAMEVVTEPETEAFPEPVAARRVPRLPSEAPAGSTVITFSLEPELEALEAWESLLGARPLRRMLRR